MGLYSQEQFDKIVQDCEAIIRRSRELIEQSKALIRNEQSPTSQHSPQPSHPEK